MCGIAGEIRFDHTVSNPATTKAMCDAQVHRGPDDEGYYANGPVSLGIRRLAIIDLSKGLYPLHNEQSTIHLVFNGEIYGFPALRTELEEHGHRFHSNTDAEILVHGYEEWGTECLQRLNGMYAFALWDETEQLLWIARDPFGIKPLYYHQDDTFFAFASEIKPLLTRPDVFVRPNMNVIGQYLQSGQVDITEETFFDGINRLAPAHYLVIRPNRTIERERYWNPRVSRNLDGETSREEIERTRNLFLKAIGRQLVSDVPVGTCLSGGIDSSSVVCAVKIIHPNGAISTGGQIRTFSAIFPGDAADESRYVKTVCEAAQVEHNPVTPTAVELWHDLSTLVRCQEEPFGSTGIYAQWRVMKRAKERGITVMLDGQGGDELLGGYLHYYINYLLTLKKRKEYSKLLVEGALSLDLTRSLIWGYLKRLLVGTAVYRKSLMKKLAVGSDLVLADASPKKIIRPLDDLATILEMDANVISLPALLRYEDKNSMWHSVEARVPFLDRQFFEYVSSLPLDRKLRNGWTKHIFRLAMAGILPETIRLRRSKIGFQTPEKKWIEELRSRLKEFFSYSNLMATRYYNVEALRELLDKPKLTYEDANLIWRITNLELWHREFFPATPSVGTGCLHR